MTLHLLALTLLAQVTPAAVPRTVMFALSTHTEPRTVRRCTPGAVPGTVIGSVQASKVNQVARHVAAIVRKYNLPEKLFVVHQFTPNMIAGKERVQEPPGLAMTMNVDGFGDRPNKIAKYHQFTHDGTRFHRGYKLFYEEDTNLMRPQSVLALQPPPDFVVYE